jgi:tRNA nucleotidyltransferase (CCA-adding enzyme)
MKKFLVGGAVRDMLMGVTPKDHDYVVVGSTVEEMLADGFTQVGADFPVFLKDGEEYALARREKKTGVGYLGFESEFGVDVTLEEDLGRRDLTINSISMERMEDTEFFVSGDEGSYAVFDPYGGKDDLHNKVLRHTSNAFTEDPVRVLRLARFRARFGAEWSVASETKDLVHTMAKKGVLGELQAERVWKELSRALMEPFPRLFFDTLLECDALHVLFPEVYSLCSAMESRKWHPEGNAYEHTMLVLTQAALNDYDLESRLAALVHDFGKGLTRKENFPRHYGHDVNGVPVVENFCNRLTVPTKMRDRAMKACRYHMSMHKLDTLNPKTFVHMFMDMGSWNDPETIGVLYRVGVCDERGRLGSETNSLSELYMLYTVWDKVSSVKFADVFPNGETNPDKIKQGLLKARIAAASEAKK